MNVPDSASYPVVVSLCDRTGNMVRPWARHGFYCWCIDIANRDEWEGRIRYINADVVDWEFIAEYPPLIVFAFPPCVDLAASGARWWKNKGLPALSKGIGLVARCVELGEQSGAPWMVENPIGALSTHWRKPDAQFDPCDYGGYLDPPGDEYMKRTCLWVGGGFNVPLPKPVFPYEGSRMVMVPERNDRAEIRSETPMGFAEAVFHANRAQALRRIEAELARRDAAAHGDNAA